MNTLEPDTGPQKFDATRRWDPLPPRAGNPDGMRSREHGSVSGTHRSNPDHRAGRRPRVRRLRWCSSLIEPLAVYRIVDLQPFGMDVSQHMDDLAATRNPVLVLKVRE